MRKSHKNHHESEEGRTEPVVAEEGETGPEQQTNDATALPNSEPDAGRKGVTASPAGQDAEPAAGQEMPGALTERLAQELAELKNKYLRLQADFDNYRKRVSKEVVAARLVAQLDTLYPILPVFDYLEMAAANAEKADNLEVIRDGLKIIFQEFNRALTELGIAKVDAVGQTFDPAAHEAVSREPSTEVEEGVVIKQWRCGYKLGEHLIRPANVVVSSGLPDREGE